MQSDDCIQTGDCIQSPTRVLFERLVCVADRNFPVKCVYDHTKMPMSSNIKTAKATKCC